MVQNKVLIVDDEKDILDIVSDIVEDANYKPLRARNSQEAFELIAEKMPEAVILDIWLKDSELDGLGILEFMKKKYQDIPVIMISGHGNIETALRSLKLGAFDYIEKPFKQDKLINTLNKAIEFSRLSKENRDLVIKSQHIDFLYGDSNTVKALKSEIDRVSKTESRVFLNGEIGVGKDSIARMIHNLSKRNNARFVKLDLYSYDPKDIEEVLFGTEDSGDLNSPARRVGLVELANGGSLYLSEVCDIPKEAQSRLVKFLTDGKFTRVGGTKTIESNVRIIASTNRDVDKKIRDGEFRSDLYHRLNVVNLKIPSLKERREDIPMLVEFFNDHFSKKYNFPKRRITNEAVIALQSYNWPGNIRQLLNVIEWLLITNTGEQGENIKTSMLPEEILSGSVTSEISVATTGSSATPQNKELMSLKLRDARQVFERQYLMAQINRFGGNISRTASFVGMERSALHRKLKSLDLVKESEDLKEVA
ncbi:MAG TPA: sigma-54-dependent Fis family transcriptional regulator [Alphaproteobacteria bacterium]|nr:sigma-54-dependent Fis family transcriptional regulator [Alphaproteobacteria bacterium]